MTTDSARVVALRVTADERARIVALILTRAERMAEALVELEASPNKGNEYERRIALGAKVATLRSLAHDLAKGCQS